ncbi:MAG: hypothetical protein ACTSP2_00680 [Alphaproteobacteria bacterium]
MTRYLSWLGVRSQWWLAAFCVLALALPSLSSLLRPLLPGFVVLLLTLAMTRIDPKEVTARLASPRHIVRLAVLTVLLLPVSAGLAAALIAWLDIGPPLSLMLLIFAAAPPISSAAALCLILGFDALLALELTVVATLATPLVGPVLFVFAAGEPLQIPAGALFVRLLAMVAAAAVLAALTRRLLGARWIADNGSAFDGLVAIAMGLFVIPLFAGIGATVVARPLAALGILVLAVCLNLGANVLVYALLVRRVGRATAGALGFMWGNRNLALYLAAVPTDPLTSLFVALYQFPMYFTPLIWSWFAGKPDR